MMMGKQWVKSQGVYRWASEASIPVKETSSNNGSVVSILFGSIYFTGDILAATDQLELFCRQSKIRTRGMSQNKEKGHFVKKTLSCWWCMVRCYGCYANGFRFDSHLADFRFVFFLCFFLVFSRLHLGVTFRG